MTSNRPYLIRAFYEWISDNDYTPYLLINANNASAVIPRAFVDDGKIILNVADRAVRGLELSNEAVTFQARFGGQPMNVYVPVEAVMAIYAQENGEGMFFAEDPVDPDGPDGGTETALGAKPLKKPEASKRPALRVVK